MSNHFQDNIKKILVLKILKRNHLLLYLKRRVWNYRGWFGQPIIHFLKYQKTRRKIGQKITWPRVLHLILYRVFRYFRKWKTRSRTKFNCFEVDYRQKTEVITRDKLYLTRPRIYLLFFSPISSQSDVEKHLVALCRHISLIYILPSQIR